MKTAIVGAGICGLYLARKLAGEGHQVTVFEKRSEIGKAVCSGLFSERLFDFFPESKELAENSVEGALIHFPSKTLKLKFAGDFFVISHRRLDNLAAQQAEKAGAELILNSDISRLPDFPLVIGCDGALSRIRKILKLPEPRYWSGIQGFLEKEDNSSFVETWPTGRGGFIWKIPRGKNTEYGIMEKMHSAKKIFDEFLKKEKIVLRDVKSALIPQGLVLPANAKVTLCGDASGLTKPWSGGGVVWNLIQSDLLLRNFPNFLKYKKEAENLFLPKIVFGNMAKKIIYFSGFNLPWIMPASYRIDGDFIL